MLGTASCGSMLGSVCRRSPWIRERPEYPTRSPDKRIGPPAFLYRFAFQQIILCLTVTLLLSSSRRGRRDAQSSSDSLSSPGGRRTRGGGFGSDQAIRCYLFERAVASNGQWSGSLSVWSKSERKSRITVGGGKCMWLLRFRWPITIGQCLGEGTRSRLVLTGEPRQWYARLLENEALIPRNGWNSGRRINVENARTRIRGSRPIRRLVPRSRQPVLVRSRNNSA
jgi:hypothetical protein